MREDDVRQITGDIIDSAMKIHKMFGPGMLESVYERMLAIELKRRGHSVECQKTVGFTYEGEAFEDAFRLDLLVDGEVVGTGSRIDDHITRVYVLPEHEGKGYG